MMRHVLTAIMLCLAGAGVALAQTTTPIPPPLPTQAMWEQVGTANAIVATIPPDLSVQNGVNVVADPNTVLLFGYAKYILAPSSADRWAGPFAPVIQHTFIGVGMMFSLMTVYGLIYVVSNAGGWLMYLLEGMRKALDLLFQAVQAAPVLLVLVVILFIAFALFSQPEVMKWIEEQMVGVIEWVYQIVNQLTGGAQS